MALLMLFVAALVRLICASNRIDTANPAASSSGDTILDPDDRRANDLASFDEESDRSRALDCADVFVLMTIALSVRYVRLPHTEALTEKRHPLPLAEIDLSRILPSPPWLFLATSRRVALATFESIDPPQERILGEIPDLEGGKTLSGRGVVAR